MIRNLCKSVKYKINIILICIITESSTKFFKSSGNSFKSSWRAVDTTLRLPERSCSPFIFPIFSCVLDYSAITFIMSLLWRFSGSFCVTKRSECARPWMPAALLQSFVEYLSCIWLWQCLNEKKQRMGTFSTFRHPTCSAKYPDLGTWTVDGAYNPWLDEEQEASLHFLLTWSSEKQHPSVPSPQVLSSLADWHNFQTDRHSQYHSKRLHSRWEEVPPVCDQCGATSAWIQLSSSWAQHKMVHYKSTEFHGCSSLVQIYLSKSHLTSWPVWLVTATEFFAVSWHHLIQFQSLSNCKYSLGIDGMIWYVEWYNPTKHVLWNSDDFVQYERYVLLEFRNNINAVENSMHGAIPTSKLHELPGESRTFKLTMLPLEDKPIKLLQPVECRRILKDQVEGLKYQE